ncbi:ABC transporter substrate-binding protein [Reyranella sp. CPCC 100927]|uniref:ABC transporter substrate-binding protein n=1 Tax=Reyranella sp. CPCC 100927 TaxID=2599616 RepID=UPI0011B41013|nr:extracellular solute-binding protein [Reyranella sp. CPCC 100927]TWT10277.1 extracellular solute-binding protein [Reyranella sp. CPCC 100927]
MLRLLVTIVAALALAGPAPVAAQTDAEWQKVIEAAKKEGKLALYTAAIGATFHKDVVRSFEAKYGIRVEAFEARASEVRERIRIEQAAGRFLGDVHHNGATTTWLMLQDGALQPHGGIPNIRNLMPLYQADAHRVPSDVTSYALLVNRTMVKEADEPRSWQDLLDPKWSGKMLADDMRALGGGAVFFFVTHDLFGKAYHEKLAAQKLVFSRDLRNNERRTARGEYPIYFPFSLAFYTQIKSLPVKLVVPVEGRPFVRFELSVLKNAPHPNAARLFINHFLEIESQLIYANAGSSPVVKGVIERASPDMRPFLATKAMGTTTPERQNEMLDLAKQYYK